jgi:phenylalanyl-tRNA synthetase beta chain
VKFSYNWIREFVDGLSVAAPELERLITLKTAECEGIEAVGEPFAPDSVIEIDNKSITHRPDLWGHLGMAREVAAILGKRLKDPVKLELIPPAAGTIAVSIQNLGLCPRYSALVVENVSVKPSPAWLQARLTAVGLNPINNVVDMTNYVMAELAQPMHAFDREMLQGGTIFIRPAQDGEPFRALNEQEYRLSP